MKGGAHLCTQAIIKKLFDGIDKGQPIKEVRSPITISILQSIIEAMDHMQCGSFVSYMYKCLFTFMYFACARVGEVAKSQGQTQHIIQVKDLEFIPQSQTSPASFLVLFKSFKHNKSGALHKIPLKPQAVGLSPVKMVLDWLAIRGYNPGPLFLDISGKPISAHQVSAMLKKCLRSVGLEADRYGTHSFRIGRCSDLVKQGETDTQLRFLGRFHSEAFIKYVRPQVLGW